MRKKSISKDLKGHFLALGQAINTKPKSHKTWKTKELISTSDAIQNDQILSSYKLTKTEIYTISSAWYLTIVDRKSRIDPLKLIGSLFSIPEKQLKKLDVIVSLISKKVFITYNNAGMRFIKNKKSNDLLRYPKSKLINKDIVFDQSFIKCLFGEGDNLIPPTITPYQSNEELLFDWFEYLECLEKLSINELPLINLNINTNEQSFEKQQQLFEIKNQIDNRLAITKMKFPLNQLMNEHDLDHNEKIIVVSLLKSNLDGFSSYDDKVLKIISKDKLSLNNNRHYLNEESKLIINDLVEISKGKFSKQKYIQLNQDVCDKILIRNTSLEKISLTQMVSTNDLFAIMEPTQTIDDLILPSELKKTILSGFSLFSNNVEKTLQKWGLHESVLKESSMNKNENSPGFAILFHGKSGTGKTFAAGSIGSHLGKQLLVTDMSKIQSKWVGESEQNVSRLFRSYNKIVSDSDNPPVLLLNEADQFLSKRVADIKSSVSAMHNAMQNIFLEGLERIKGIVIATTNNVNNIDTAYSRRFHIKVEFPMPGILERIKLWKLFLPDSIPGSNEIDIDSLSKQYEFTGGQINMIVRNSATVAASRSKNQRLMQSDIIKYCELEQNNKFDNSRNRIGFI
ncbi:ATP-binding protein [Candidatus Neomarinimicrobiota bacterium]